MMIPFKAILLALFGLSLSVSISATTALAAVLLLWWAVELVVKRPTGNLARFPLDLPMFLFAFSTVAIVSLTHSTSLLRALSNASSFLLFIWAAHGLSSQELSRLGRWFLIGAAVAGLWALVQVFSGINYLPDSNTHVVPETFKSWPSTIIHYMAVRNERAVGPRSHPLTYAECFIPAFFIFLSYAFRLTRISWKMTAGLISVSLAVLFSQSRAVWVGLFIGTLFYIYISKRWKLLLLLVVLSGVSIPAVVSFSPSLKNRVESIFTFSGGREADQQSKTTRTHLWRVALESIRERPWIGTGLKGAVLHGVDPGTRQPRIWTEAHNNFLQVALENGLVGLGIYLWIWVVIAKILMQPGWPLRTAFAAMVLAFFIAGLTESWGRDKEVAMLFSVVLGAMENRRRNEI